MTRNRNQTGGPRRGDRSITQTDDEELRAAFLSMSKATLFDLALDLVRRVEGNEHLDGAPLYRALQTLMDERDHARAENARLRALLAEPSDDEAERLWGLVPPPTVLTGDLVAAQGEWNRRRVCAILADLRARAGEPNAS